MTYEMPNEFIRSQEKMKQSEQNERKDLNGCSRSNSAKRLRHKERHILCFITF